MRCLVDFPYLTKLCCGFRVPRNFHFESTRTQQYGSMQTRPVSPRDKSGPCKISRDAEKRAQVQVNLRSVRWRPICSLAAGLVSTTDKFLAYKYTSMLSFTADIVFYIYHFQYSESVCATTPGIWHVKGRVVANWPRQRRLIASRRLVRKTGNAGAMLFSIMFNNWLLQTHRQSRLYFFRNDLNISLTSIVTRQVLDNERREDKQRIRSLPYKAVHCTDCVSMEM